VDTNSVALSDLTFRGRDPIPATIESHSKPIVILTWRDGPGYIGFRDASELLASALSSACTPGSKFGGSEYECSVANLYQGLYLLKNCTRRKLLRRWREIFSASGAGSRKHLELRGGSFRGLVRANNLAPNLLNTYVE
jgi:hypothetical protein